MGWVVYCFNLESANVANGSVECRRYYAHSGIELREPVDSRLLCSTIIIARCAQSQVFIECYHKCMHILATIGELDTAIRYTDRPTVKVVLKNEDKLLILNKGLLPGGGINPGESDYDTINRELQEELGVTVKNIQEIGTVVQYRNLLSKKYLINGYVAELETTRGLTDPQDEGEAQFTIEWPTLDEAMVHTSRSIEAARLMPMDDDTNQGRLYNFMTTYELLKSLHS